MRVKEEIIGERLRLSNIHNRMNEERFADLRICIERFKNKIKDQALKEIFDKCFFNTLSK